MNKDLSPQASNRLAVEAQNSNSESLFDPAAVQMLNLEDVKSSSSDGEPDFELILHQQSRSTPKVSLSEIEGEEKVLLEFQDFGTLASHNQVGLLSTGQEEKLSQACLKLSK